MNLPIHQAIRLILLASSTSKKTQGSSKSKKTKASSKEALPFHLLSFNEFVASGKKDEIAKNEAKADKVISAFKANVEPAMLDKYVRAILTNSYSFKVFNAEHSPKSNAKNAHAVSEQSVTPVDTPAKLAGDNVSAVVGQVGTNNVDLNQQIGIASNQLELQINQAVKKFQGDIEQVWKAQKEQQSKSTLSNKELRAAKYVSNRIRSNTSYWGKYFCNFKYLHVWKNYATELKEQYHYFNYHPSQSLQNIADRLAKALSRWQSNISGFPRYKSQHNKTLGQEFSLYFTNQQIKVD